MLKNIEEFENNPIFSSGGSVCEEREKTVIPVLALEEAKTQLCMMNEEFKESEPPEHEGSKRYKMAAIDDEPSDSMGYLDDEEEVSIEHDIKERLVRESVDSF